MSLWAKYFTREDESRLFITFYLFASRFYASIRRTYFKLHFDLQETVKVAGQQQQHDDEQPSFVQIPWLFRIYHRLSTSWMLYSLTRSCFPDAYKLIIRPLNFTSMPDHCLLMARLVLSVRFERVGSATLSLCHLAWRSFHKFRRRSFNLSYVFFLLADQGDIERTLARCAPVATSNELPASQSGYLSLRPDMTAREIFIIKTVCYKYHQLAAGSQQVGGLELYRPRPNRSPAARLQLRDHMIRFTMLLTGVYTLALTLPITTVITLVVLSDHHYVQVYPNCSRNLSELYATGQLPWWSVTLNTHHFVSGVIDGVENFVIWMDSGIALIYVAAIAYLLSHDLTLYWEHLDRKILHNLNLVRWYNDEHGVINNAHIGFLAGGNRHVATNLAQSSRQLSYVRSELPNQMGDIDLTMKPAMVRPREPRTCSHSMDQVSFEPAGWRTLDAKMQAQDLVELEVSLADLQSQLFDFFTQVECTDVAVSDLLTACICVWLTSFSCFSASVMIGSLEQMPPVVFLVHLLGFTVLTVFSLVIRRLYKCCRQSHRSLCSLMALDQTSQKQAYPKLMEFFSGRRNRTTFSVMHTIPYVPSVYFTLIGWSFSCYFVAHNLISRSL